MFYFIQCSKAMQSICFLTLKVLSEGMYTHKKVCYHKMGSNITFDTNSKVGKCMNQSSLFCKLLNELCW